MLIAIMADTFDKITENIQLNSTRTRIELMGEMANNIKSKEEDRRHFMYVVTPDEQEVDETGSWEGSIK